MVQIKSKIFCHFYNAGYTNTMDSVYTENVIDHSIDSLKSLRFITYMSFKHPLHRIAATLMYIMSQHNHWLYTYFF